MTNQPKSSKAMHYSLWSVQIVLAASLMWAAWMKLVQPIDQLASMWPWACQVPIALVKFTGVVDLIGALGLIMPSLFQIRPKLTPVAAVALVGLMLCAGLFHVRRGEASAIGVNSMFAILAAFVAWGRLKKAPIAPR